MAAGSNAGVAMICTRCGSERMGQRFVEPKASGPLSFGGTAGAVVLGGCGFVLLLLLVVFSMGLILLIVAPVMLVVGLLLFATKAQADKRKKQAILADPRNYIITCMDCSSTELIPLLSPRGRQLQQQFLVPPPDPRPTEQAGG